jgi:type III pantothenate kinase
MIIACDIGNTHILVGVWKNNKLIKFWRLQSAIQKTEDEFYASIKFLLNESNFKIKDISGIVISSVVPTLTKVFKHLVEKYLNLQPLIVSADLNLGITYKIKYPTRIGADLIANAFAAHKKYGGKTGRKNCIIVDFGTATTIQLISQKGEFLGTAICPGVETSAESLFKKAAQLGQIKLVSPKSIIGNDTNSAMLSGIILGTAFMVDGFIEIIKENYATLNGEFLTIATGGIADLVCKHTKFIDIVNKNLTLEGLILIYNHLTKETAYIS